MFDLSNDNEAQPIIPVNLNTSDLRYARVLTKAIYVASHFRPVINDRLLSLVRSKLWQMGKALSRKNTLQRQQIFNHWQKNDWTIELKASEVWSSVIEENAQLQRKLEKSKLEADKLEEEKSVVEAALEEVETGLCVKLTCEKSKNEQLPKKLEIETSVRSPLQTLNGSVAIRTPPQSSVAGAQKHKSWEEYSRRHKKRKIQELKNKVLDMSDNQYEVSIVHVRNKDTGSTEIVSTNAIRIQVAEAPQSDNDLRKVLLVKSSMEFKIRPTMNLACLTSTFHGHVKFRRKSNRLLINGKYFLLQETLPELNSHYHCDFQKGYKLSMSPTRQSHKVRVKLTGDGTYIGPRQHIVTFGFTLLDEGDRAHSPSGNYTVCIFRSSESHLIAYGI